ncbi:MAG: DUF3108 domain-containing protein [bacterium]|nr:MAG: DUF3108 domain-containing protein [bacterium]
MDYTTKIEKAFNFKEFRLAVFWIVVPLFLFHFPIHAQPKKKADTDTLKLVKTDSTLRESSYEPKIILDSIRPKPIQVSPKLDESYIDSIDELFENEEIIIPTPIDTTGKIRLPVNLKKTKFAYFDASQSIDRVIPNNAFHVGEKLTFVIRYGPVVAGSSTMSIPAVTNIKGNKSYKIVTEARSSAFFSTFYKVRDRVESYVDQDGLFSWRFEKHLREGKYRADQLVEYDHVNGWAVSNKKDTMKIPPCVQDILSSFYYVRTQELEVGRSLFIDNHADNKLYPLEIKVHKKERIKIRAGEFDCLVVEPILRATGLFKSKGRLLVWLTDDERKIPVQMKSKIFIGYITAELKEMEGVKEVADVGI